MRIFLYPGLAEGKWHSRQFIRNSTKGAVLVDSPVDADVIITHSGGVYQLQSPHQAKLVLIVNQPQLGAPSTVRAIAQKVWRETKDRYWAEKLAWNTIYWFADLPKWARMYRRHRQWSPAELDATNVAFVRNSEDVFGRYDEDLRLAREVSGVAILVAGQHDDLWINPDRYLEIAEKHI